MFQRFKVVFTNKLKVVSRQQLPAPLVWEAELGSKIMLSCVGLGLIILSHLVCVQLCWSWKDEIQI